MLTLYASLALMVANGACSAYRKIHVAPIARFTLDLMEPFDKHVSKISGSEPWQIADLSPPYLVVCHRISLPALQAFRAFLLSLWRVSLSEF